MIEITEYTANGSRVTLLINWAVRVSSTKPITEVNAVPLITCTRKPTVGGIAIVTAWGIITYHNS